MTREYTKITIYGKCYKNYYKTVIYDVTRKECPSLSSTSFRSLVALIPDLKTLAKSRKNALNGVLN